MVAKNVETKGSDNNIQAPASSYTLEIRLNPDFPGLGTNKFSVCLSYFELNIYNNESPYIILNNEEGNEVSANSIIFLLLPRSMITILECK